MRDPSLTPRQLWRVVVALLLLASVAVVAGMVAFEAMTVERAGWVTAIVGVASVALAVVGVGLPDDLDVDDEEPPAS